LKNVSAHNFGGLLLPFGCKYNATDWLRKKTAPFFIWFNGYRPEAQNQGMEQGKEPAVKFGLYGNFLLCVWSSSEG
jgi:hypothetical protein